MSIFRRGFFTILPNPLAKGLIYVTWLTSSRLNDKILLFFVLLQCRCGCTVGNVTFAEFAQFVVDVWSTGKRLDVHWRPQHHLCSPCYIKYDFVGRFEHLNDDAKHVLARITASGGPGSNVTFPLSNTSGALSQQLRQFYADVSHDIVRKLIRIYKHDYELFGYDYHWACNDC